MEQSWCTWNGLKIDGEPEEGAEEGRGTPAALLGDALYGEQKKNGNVRVTHPTIISAIHLLIPRGLAHVSEGRTEGFISNTRTIFRARFHLGRHKREWLTPRFV